MVSIIYYRYCISFKTYHAKFYFWSAPETGGAWPVEAEKCAFYITWIIFYRYVVFDVALMGYSPESVSVCGFEKKTCRMCNAMEDTSAKVMSSMELYIII